MIIQREDKMQRNKIIQATLNIQHLLDSDVSPACQRDRQRDGDGVEDL